MTAVLTSEGLRTRLQKAAIHFPVEQSWLDSLSERRLGEILSTLAVVARDHSGTELTWLLMVVVTGRFPTPAEFRRCHRRLRMSLPGTAHRAILESAVRNPDGLNLGDWDIEIVSGQVVVDVDFCAKNDHNTGIQRVVRQTMSRWHRDRQLVPVAWTDHAESMRSLSDVELARVVHYGSPRDASPEPAAPQRLVVPFRSAVVLLEVPWKQLCGPLEALAEYSGNAVGLLGYDAIPVVSADTVPEAETNRFVDYLSIVKHSSVVVGISAAATAEFAGFVTAVSAQGLPGPATVSVPLPVDIPDAIASTEPSAGSVPLVLCVGSQEPRKNHYAILHAAEVLWKEGLQFSLRFIGGGSAWYVRGFDRHVARLARAGHRIEVLRGVNDATLLGSYRDAAFTVFPSLHEGYGLPVAESLALGVPVITSSYGSTAEIAADGGCLTVDPRNDAELIEAMRQLLVNPQLLAQLRQDILARPKRTWDDYETELWHALVQPVLAEARGANA